jgi:hypothetical protein
MKKINADGEPHVHACRHTRTGGAGDLQIRHDHSVFSSLNKDTHFKERDLWDDPEQDGLSEPVDVTVTRCALILEVFGSNLVLDTGYLIMFVV